MINEQKYDIINSVISKSLGALAPFEFGLDVLHLNFQKIVLAFLENL